MTNEKGRYGSSGMGRQNTSLVHYCTTLCTFREGIWPIRMSMEKELNTEWALNAEANVSQRIDIELKCKKFEMLIDTRYEIQC